MVLWQLIFLKWFKGMNTSKSPALSCSAMATWSQTSSASNNPVLWTALHGTPCLQWEGWRLFFYYIISQGIGLYILFHLLFPSVEEFRWGEGGRADVLRCKMPAVAQFDSSRSPVHAASHLSWISHLKATLCPWKAPTTFSCLKGFKAGFILALCHNWIKAATAEAGWCMDSPMPSLWGSFFCPPPFVPALWIWSFHTNIAENLVLPENKSNPKYCIALLSISGAARKTGVDKGVIKPDKKGFLVAS